MPRDGQPDAAVTRRVTLRDVAARAGVATSTASLVFSGSKPVAAATAELVRTAAVELGYAGPDPVASSLRHGRTGVVAAVVEQRILHAFRDPFVVAVLDGLAHVIGEMGAGLLLLPDAGEGQGDAGPQVARLAADAAVFIMCGTEANPLAEQFVARGLPVVGTGAPTGPGIVQVQVPERAAMVQVSKHLWALGHRRVGHIMMPLTWDHRTGGRTVEEVRRSRFPDARERALGVHEVFGRSAALIEAAEADFDGGRASAGMLLDGGEPPTALIAQSDLLAAGAVQAVLDRGLRVPQDVSVSGFDGVVLPWFGRTLTTIDQRPLEKGFAIGEVVRELLAGKAVEHVAFDVSLRVGDTTGPVSRTRGSLEVP